jgi:putative ABC transport system permease protein
VLLLVAGAGLLAPALVRPVARLLTAPLSRLRGAAALVASTSATASARRTAAIAAPVLVTVGLAASLLTASALTDEARAALRKPARESAFVVVPTGDGIGGLDRALTGALGGAELSAPTSVYTLEGDTPATRRSTGSPADAYVGPGRAFSALPTVAYVPATFTHSSLAALLAGHDARIATAPAAEPGNSASRTGLLVVLAIVLGYTTLALVNTLLMAAPDRAGEHRTLRLLGATAPQVLRATTLEVLIAFAVGVVLAVLCLAVTVAGLWLALLRVAGPLPITFPWPVVGAVTAGAALLAVLTAATATRGRPAATGRPAGCR